MFSLYALLGEGAPVISAESLAAELKGLFRDQEGFSLQHEQKCPNEESKTCASQMAG
jgi:hypothetical protein